MEVKELSYTEVFKKVKKASRPLSQIGNEKANAILIDLSEELVKQSDFLLTENAKDLARMDKNDPKYDRLKLTQPRLEGIAAEMKQVAKLDSPLGKVLLNKTVSSGLHITKVTVPLGVIGIIYEARPNVTFDVFALCLKSGNACILKGGSDAIDSNIAIIKVIHKVLSKHDVSTSVVELLGAGRDATEAILNAIGYVDVIIPRGSQGLINFVRQNSKVPVIETGAGIVHTYFDESADLEKGKKIIFNAKTRRVSVCNALDCLIIHKKRLNDLSEIAALLAKDNVEIFADEASYKALENKYPSQLLSHATNAHFGTEFLDYKMAVKTVSSLDEALNHIENFSSNHSEAILSENQENIEKFLNTVDAAAVYANASTAYTDGAQFGMGAEIGISTQKLHARGPMALEELTSYKWIVKGNGQARP